MALTAEQHAKRDSKIGASFLPALMAGNKERILNEWQRIIGDPAYVPDDLSDIWAVQFGSFIEPFALDWFQKKSGYRLTRRGEWVNHPNRQYLGCTLDAYVIETDTVLDCKALGAYRKLDEAISYYIPQIIAQAACVVSRRGALLIVHGGSEPTEYEVTWTPEYEALVWERVDQFWQCVINLTPPFAMEAAMVSVIPVKEYDFSTSNEFCNEAAIWLENKDASKKFDGAAKAIKAAVPADGMRAFGGGVVVTRNKAGSLSIRES